MQRSIPYHPHPHPRGHSGALSSEGDSVRSLQRPMPQTLGLWELISLSVPWAHPSPTTALTALVFWGPWAVRGGRRLRHLGNRRCGLKILPEVALLTEGRSLRCWRRRGRKGPAPFRGDDLGPSARGAGQQTYCSTRLIFVNPNFTNGLWCPRGPSFMEQNLFPPRAPGPVDAGRLPHMGVI